MMIAGKSQTAYIMSMSSIRPWRDIARRPDADRDRNQDADDSRCQRHCQTFDQADIDIVPARDEIGRQKALKQTPCARQAFGQPLSAFQGVSHPLAELDTQVEAARLLCLQALWLKDRGLPHAAEAAMCKWWAPKLAYDVVHQCLLMHGHGGYDRGPMEQRLRDILGFQIGDGTAQIMKTVIARTRAGRKAVPA
jgi:hypothetical protein